MARQFRRRVAGPRRRTRRRRMARPARPHGDRGIGRPAALHTRAVLTAMDLHDGGRRGGRGTLDPRVGPAPGPVGRDGRGGALARAGGADPAQPIPLPVGGVPVDLAHRPAGGGWSPSGVGAKRRRLPWQRRRWSRALVAAPAARAAADGPSRDRAGLGAPFDELEVCAARRTYVAVPPASPAPGGRPSKGVCHDCTN